MTANSSIVNVTDIAQAIKVVSALKSQFRPRHLPREAEDCLCHHKERVVTELRAIGIDLDKLRLVDGTVGAFVPGPGAYGGSNLRLSQECMWVINLLDILTKYLCSLPLADSK